MGDLKSGRSDKYAGVYWHMVKRLDGMGLERMYYVRYRLGGRGSKEIKEPVGRASEGMTEAKANLERAARMTGKKQSNKEQRQALEKERLTGPGPLTISRLWEIYLAEHEGNRSIRDDVNRYDRHIAPHLGSLLATGLATENVAALRGKLERYGLSPQSVKHCLALLKRIVRYGERLGILTLASPVFFDMPKVDNRKTENMTREQLAAYWRALDNEPDQDAAAFFKLELLTGIRRGAAMALMWSDCDFENDIITLRGESAKNEKTAHIPMNAAVKEILLAITRTSDYVFPGMDGSRRKVAPKMGKRICQLAGLPDDFRPNHGLRHTFASLLASSGNVDLYTLQKLLTHGNPAMTQRYAHLADEAMRKAANVASDIVPDAGKEQS